jgi:hypothetical protein
MFDLERASLDFKKEIGKHNANVQETAKVERHQIDVEL